MYNRDLAGTRYSPLTRITRKNLPALAQAWSYRLQPAGFRHATLCRDHATIQSAIMIYEYVVGRVEKFARRIAERLENPRPADRRGGDDHDEDSGVEPRIRG